MRTLVIVYCSMVKVDNNVRQQISEALGLGQTDPTGTRGLNQESSPDTFRRVEPRIEKPSLTNQFLNLFKVNGNYYAQAQPGNQPSLQSQATRELKDAPGQSSQQDNQNKKDREQVPLQNRPENVQGVTDKDKIDQEQEDDGICSICCNQGENCIIMDCRHGGICKVCSIDILKTKGLCPFCRLSINKICVVTKVSDVQYKVLEEIRV